MTKLKDKAIGRLKQLAVDLAGRWPSSADEGHLFDTAAFLAAVLNDILAFITCRVTLLQPHRPPADDAGYQCEQRAAVIVHERAIRGRAYWPSTLPRISTLSQPLQARRNEEGLGPRPRGTETCPPHAVFPFACPMPPLRS